jgi:hypothetical protein
MDPGTLFGILFVVAKVVIYAGLVYYAIREVARERKK